MEVQTSCVLLFTVFYFDQDLRVPTAIAPAGVLISTLVSKSAKQSKSKYFVSHGRGDTMHTGMVEEDSRVYPLLLKLS